MPPKKNLPPDTLAEFYAVIEASATNSLTEIEAIYYDAANALLKLAKTLKPLGHPNAKRYFILAKEIYNEAEIKFSGG